MKTGKKKTPCKARAKTPSPVTLTNLAKLTAEKLANTVGPRATAAEQAKTSAKTMKETGGGIYLYGVGIVPATHENIRKAAEWARRIPLWSLTATSKKKPGLDRHVADFLWAAHQCIPIDPETGKLELPPYPQGLASAYIVEEFIAAAICGDAAAIKRIADAVKRMHPLGHGVGKSFYIDPTSQMRAKALAYVEANGAPASIAETEKILVAAGFQQDGNREGRVALDEAEVRRWHKDLGGKARGPGRPLHRENRTKHRETLS